MQVLVLCSVLPWCVSGGLNIISLDSEKAWAIRNATSSIGGESNKLITAPVPGTIPGALFAAGTGSGHTHIHIICMRWYSVVAFIVFSLVVVVDTHIICMRW